MDQNQPNNAKQAAEPVRLLARGRVPKYPWYSMNIGDWFDIDPPMTPAKLIGTRRNAEQKSGRKFMCRTMKDGRVRVWRFE